jgi:DHA2 family multidrug resistance protein
MTSWFHKFGRRNYFAVSIIIFITVALFLCGNATNIWELVAFRFIQGLGGVLIVTAQTIITESYPIAKTSSPSHLWYGSCVGPTWVRP